MYIGASQDFRAGSRAPSPILVYVLCGLCAGAVLEGGPGGASAPLTLSPAPPAGPPERGVGINNTNITIAPPPPPRRTLRSPPPPSDITIASHPPPPSDITMASHRIAPHHTPPPPRRTLRSAPPTACRPPPGPPNKIILEPPLSVWYPECTETGFCRMSPVNSQLVFLASMPAVPSNTSTADRR